MRLTGVVTVLAIAALAVPGGAVAAPGWVSPPATVSAASGGVPSPQVASNARGDTAVAWLDPATGHVLVSERPVGGIFTVGSPVSLTADQVLGSIAIDGAGTIYVFFATNQSTPASSQPNVGVKAIGAGSWAVTPLAAANNLDPPQAPILGAVTPAGKAVAVWFQGHTNNATLSKWQFAAKPAGSPAFSAKADIPGSTGNAPGSPHLVMNAAGQAAFVYASQGCPGFAALAVGATMSAANAWTTVNAMETCAPGGAGLAGGPVVDIDTNGTATSAWSRTNAVNTIVQFATKAIGAASWPTTPASPTPNDLSATGADAGAPAVAVAADGTTTVAWVRDGVVQERTRPAVGGAFAAATTVPNTLSSPSPPVLAAAADGSAVVLWSGLDPAVKNVIGGARRAPGGALFGALPQAPGVDNTGPVLATDDQGNAPGAWVHNASGQYSVQASALDAAPPAISSLTFPAAATLGVAFPYGATLSDRWSTPSGSWAFGDGTSGPLSGDKAYAAAGSFEATLTATDAVGNSATATRSVTVPAAAGPATTTGSGGGGADGVAPAFTSARLTNATFAVAPNGAAEKLVSAKRAKRGTTFVYTLSEAARVLFTIEQKVAGRRVGSSCRKPTRSTRSRKACTRLVRVGTFGQDGAAAGNRKAFSGRIGAKRLKPGSYQASLSARDAAGNRSKVRKLGFRVVRG